MQQLEDIFRARRAIYNCSNCDPVTQSNEFINKIDCRFPYHDLEACKALIQEGCSISSNAAFMILHEIARVPNGVEVSTERLFTILDAWDNAFDHPLKPLLIGITKEMILRRELTVENALRALDEIAKYRGEYNALNIAYFSCDDVEDLADNRHAQISKDWQDTKHT